jgi:hypothetical protein
MPIDSELEIHMESIFLKDKTSINSRGVGDDLTDHGVGSDLTHDAIGRGVGSDSTRDATSRGVGNDSTSCGDDYTSCGVAVSTTWTVEDNEAITSMIPGGSTYTEIALAMGKGLKWSDIQSRWTRHLKH